MSSLGRARRDAFRVYDEDEFFNGLGAGELSGAEAAESLDPAQSALERRLLRVAAVVMLAGAMGCVAGLIVVDRVSRGKGSRRADRAASAMGARPSGAGRVLLRQVSLLAVRTPAAVRTRRVPTALRPHAASSAGARARDRNRRARRDAAVPPVTTRAAMRPVGPAVATPVADASAPVADAAAANASAAVAAARTASSEFGFER